MKQREPVKHPKFSHDKLDGKCLAYCKNGNSFRYNLLVEEIQKDGRHFLTLQTPALAGKPDSEGVVTCLPQEWQLDQPTVGKIVAVASGSLLKRMHYDFCILEDPQSNYLNSPAAI